SAAAGHAVDRLGERPLLVAGPLGVAAATLLAALSPAPLLLTLALAGAGVALGTCAPSGGKAMLVWFPPRIRGLAMGLRQTSVPLAGVLAAATLPSLAIWLGWRGPVAHPHERAGRGTFLDLLRDRSLLASIALGPVLVAGQW